MLISSALNKLADEFSSDDVISKRDWEDTNDCTEQLYLLKKKIFAGREQWADIFI